MNKKGLIFLSACLFCTLPLISDQVIQVYRAGPCSPNQERIGRVQTSFEGKKKCKKSCFRTLLGGDTFPNNESRDTYDYERQSDPGQGFEGSDAASQAVDNSSVDVMEIPFRCPSCNR